MPRFEALSTAFVPERAILVGVDQGKSAWTCDESLAELARLVETDGAEVVASVVQRLSSPSPKTFIGSGKVEEVSTLVKSLDADVVVFDDELSPSQQSNLEKSFGSPVKVIDRTALILDIFGRHATTREGRLQVQVAQLQYLLPRLRGMWSHLAKEQSRGGIGSRFGQGESQLEVDRRLIRDRIARLRKDLKEIETRRHVQSKERAQSGVYRVALVGYTNAGKSTLLNALTDAEVYAKDELFATLDPTTRSLELDDGRKIVLTDTVGFIQKLPTNLIESFKSTLSEATEADLILLVVDASDEKYRAQMDVVRRILDDIGAADIPCVTVFNKVDLLEDDGREHAMRFPGSIATSGAQKLGLEALKLKIAGCAAAGEQTLTALIPYAEARLTKTVHESCHLMHETYQEEGILVTVRAKGRALELLRPFEVDAGE